MELINKYLFLLENMVIWTIIIVSIFSYGILIDLCFFRKTDRCWSEETRYWTSCVKSTLASLPLLGLLGTISGLLSTFLSMSLNNGLDQQETITGGLAQAMFTTQLGLVMVVPGLLMLAWLNSKHKRWVVSAR